MWSQYNQWSCVAAYTKRCIIFWYDTAGINDIYSVLFALLSTWSVPWMCTAGRLVLPRLTDAIYALIFLISLSTTKPLISLAASGRITTFCNRIIDIFQCSASHCLYILERVLSISMGENKLVQHIGNTLYIFLKRFKLGYYFKYNDIYILKPWQILEISVMSFHKKLHWNNKEKTYSPSGLYFLELQYCLWYNILAEETMPDFSIHPLNQAEFQLPIWGYPKHSFDY